MVCFCRFVHDFKWSERAKWQSMLLRVYQGCELVINIDETTRYCIKKLNHSSLSKFFGMYEFLDGSDFGLDHNAALAIVTDKVWTGCVTSALMPKYDPSLVSSAESTAAEVSVGQELARTASFFQGGREIALANPTPAADWSPSVRIEHVLRQMHEKTPLVAAYVDGRNFLIKTEDNWYGVIDGTIDQHFPLFDLDYGFEGRYAKLFPSAAADLKLWQECKDGSVTEPMVSHFEQQQQ